MVCHIIRDSLDDVINLDKLTYAGNLESLADVSTSERYAFETVDICNRAELDRVFALHQPDAVMHLAAVSLFDSQRWLSSKSLVKLSMAFGCQYIF